MCVPLNLQKENVAKNKYRDQQRLHNTLNLNLDLRSSLNSVQKNTKISSFLPNTQHGMNERMNGYRLQPIGISVFLGQAAM